LYSISIEHSLLENDEPVNKKSFSNGSQSVEDERKLCLKNQAVEQVSTDI
jgi:hypothetical protein